MGDQVGIKLIQRTKALASDGQLSKQDVAKLRGEFRKNLRDKQFESRFNTTVQYFGNLIIDPRERASLSKMFSLDDGTLNALVGPRGRSALLTYRLNQLCRLLVSNNAQSKRQAQTFLSKMGNDAIPLLLKSLMHTNAAVRWNAAAVFQKQGSKAVPALTTFLKTQISKRYTRAHPHSLAVQIIGVIGGTSAVTTLIEATKHTDPRVRAQATLELGNHKDARVLSVLLAILKSAREKTPIKVRAIWALAKVKGAKAVEAIIASLNHADPKIVSAAVSSLATLNHPKIPSALSSLALSSTDVNMRRAAIWALSTRGTRALRPLLKLIAQAKAGSRQKIHALNAIGRILKSTTVVRLLDSALMRELKMALHSALKNPSKKVRLTAALAIALIDPTSKPAMATLIKLRDVRNPYLKRRIITALKRSKLPMALPILLKESRLKSVSVRLAAISAMSAFKDPRVDKRLAQLLKDRDKSVRLAAVATFGKRNAWKLVPTLMRMLRQAIKSRDLQMQTAIGSAFARMSPPKRYAQQFSRSMNKAFALTTDLNMKLKLAIAAFALGHPSSQMKIYVAGILSTPDKRIRKTARQILFIEGNINMLPLLFNMFTNYVSNPLKDTIEAIMNRNMGPKLIPILLKGLMHKNQAVRTLTWWEIGSIARGGKVAWLAPLLIAALKSPSAKVRRVAVWNLRDLKHPKIVPALIAMCKDKDMYVRKRLFYVLGNQKDNRAYKYILAALNDPYPAIQKSAISGLGLLGDMRAVPYILDMTRSRYYQFTARLAMQDLGIKRVMPHLLKAITHSDANVRNFVEYVLTQDQMHSTKVIKAYINATGHANKGARYNAISTLTYSDSTHVEKTLKAALKDSNSLIRSGAKKALAKRAQRRKWHQ